MSYLGLVLDALSSDTLTLMTPILKMKLKKLALYLAILSIVHGVTHQGLFTRLSTGQSNWIVHATIPRYLSNRGLDNLQLFIHPHCFSNIELCPYYCLKRQKSAWSYESSTKTCVVGELSSTDIVTWSRNGNGIEVYVTKEILKSLRSSESTLDTAVCIHGVNSDLVFTVFSSQTWHIWWHHNKGLALEPQNTK